MRHLRAVRGHHNITQLYAHLVFVTKGRKKVLDPDKKDKVEDVFGEHCRVLGLRSTADPDRAERLCCLIAFGMEEDHVHLVVRYPPTVSISQLVKHLKGRSSRYGLPGVEGKQGALWASGYFAKSLSDDGVGSAVGYAKKQGTPDHTKSREERVESVKSVKSVA